MVGEVVNLKGVAFDHLFYCLKVLHSHFPHVILLSHRGPPLENVVQKEASHPGPLPLTTSQKKQLI